MQVSVEAAPHNSPAQWPGAKPHLRLLHGLVKRGARPPGEARVVETAKPDAVAWEDTEIDIRRVVL